MHPNAARDAEKLRQVSAALQQLPPSPQIDRVLGSIEGLIVDLNGDCVNNATMAMLYVEMSNALELLHDNGAENSAAAAVILQVFFDPKVVVHRC